MKKLKMRKKDITSTELVGIELMPGVKLGC